MRKGLHFVELRTLDGKIFSNLFCWAQCGKSKKWCWPVVSDWFWCEELLFTYDTHHYQILNLNLHTLQKRVRDVIPHSEYAKTLVEEEEGASQAFFFSSRSLAFLHRHYPRRRPSGKSLFSPSSHSSSLSLMGMLVMIILSDGWVKSRFLIRVWRYPYWNEIAQGIGVWRWWGYFHLNNLLIE